MKKRYSQDLNKKRKKLISDLASTEEAIKKRFFLILSNYDGYMSEDHRSFCINNTVHDLPLETMLEIMIQAEANYIEANNEQLDMFN